MYHYQEFRPFLKGLIGLALPHMPLPESWRSEWGPFSVRSEEVGSPAVPNQFTDEDRQHVVEEAFVMVLEVKPHPRLPIPQGKEQECGVHCVVSGTPAEIVEFFTKLPEAQYPETLAEVLDIVECRKILKALRRETVSSQARHKSAH